ncbi:claudin-like protein ZF-A89 [Syngnathus typhle]|uniref:claudin-like protein ZF-A89 n=1 Tax=Syngnathus typhle TaxID=161592 RepID=UPI002A6A6673|nr:claudin-like protein ZF-A89 [Syngnathus typhle]XP_061155156.1 claudin-like protein ZF-A89 [Syngnathus typhle]
MVSAGFQILGAALGLIGWIGAIVVCALPMWRVTAFIGSNIVTAQTSWEGVWMSCVVQSTGQMQCKVYDSMLALSSDLQAARALLIIAIMVGILAILLSVAGGKCTNCVKDPAAKVKVGLAGGVVFIVAGVLLLIPVCWTAHTVVRDFNNPLVASAQKRELGAMTSVGLQLLGAFLVIVGFLGAILTCALPMWRVSAFIGSNIVTAQVFWEGLWMNCVKQSTGQMQCKVYDSMLALPSDLQAARALVVIAILVVVVGLLLVGVGGKCTNCLEEEAAKTRVAAAAGVLCVLGGVLLIIPVSWSAHVVIRNFYNPLLGDAQRRELGASLFIGWGAAGLLFIGGSLFLGKCASRRDGRYSVKYSAPRSAPGGGAYV